MRVEEALGAHLKAAGTSVGSRFYLRKLPQNDQGQYSVNLPAAYFGVDRSPSHTHDENDLGARRIHHCDIEITVVARDASGVDGRRSALKAAREVEEALRTFSGLRRGVDDDGVNWAVTVGGCLMEESDAPDWHEIQQTWEVDMFIQCWASA